MAVLVEVNAGDTVVAHFTLSQSPAHPHSAEISGLKLQNPFTNEAGGMMRQRKGLPSEVANLKYQIFEIAKAGGFTQLRSEGASTFAVNFLYRGIDVITYDDGSKKQILFPRPTPRQFELLRWGWVRFNDEGRSEHTLTLDLK